MSVQTSITINDGVTPTPVAHVFQPKGVHQEGQKGTALWRDQSPANAEGFLSITEQHTDPNTNGIEKFRYVIQVPTLETPGGTGPFVPPPTKAYITTGVIEFWIHKRASAQELNNIVAFVKNLAADSRIAGAIVNREAAW
jgi:hypothetical protein